MQTSFSDDVGDAVHGVVELAAAEGDAEHARELVDEARPRDLLECAEAVCPERLGAQLVLALRLLRLGLLLGLLGLLLWLLWLHLGLGLGLRLRLHLDLGLDGEGRAGDVAVDRIDPVARVLVAVSSEHDDTCSASLGTGRKKGR